MKINFLRQAWVKAHALIWCPIFGIQKKPCLFCQKSFRPSVTVTHPDEGATADNHFEADTSDGYVASLFCSLECSEKYIHRAFLLMGMPRAATGRRIFSRVCEAPGRVLANRKRKAERRARRAVA